MRYFAVRLFEAVMTMIAVTLVVFVLIRLTGSPASTMLPADATPAEIAEMSARMGWDDPILVQYFHYVQAMFSGDFGVSLRSGLPVQEIVGEPFLASIKLTGLAILLAVLFGVPMGVRAATKPKSFTARSSSVFALLGQAVPSFWTAILMVWVFGYTLGWISFVGETGALGYLLPALCLSWGIVAGVIRLLRSSMMEVLNADYIRFARIKGMLESVVVWKHGVRNGILPVVTFIGLMFGIVVANAVAVELVFNFPGLGRLTYEAVVTRDYPLLQFAVLSWAALVVAISLTVDVVYKILDPRLGVITSDR
ncbi:hypothetical protein CH267_13070 [Rhodococcus sp. 06-621-2]|nr:ABC transporter permease [Rhodococcus sp. 06-621-2]OZC55502.1 hypothetical protein CH267_13070 [Rhodococcus sp. 06-621-2]